MGSIALIGPNQKDDLGNDTFDVAVEDISSYSIGQEVEITVKGCVGMISIPPEPGFGSPKIGIKIYSQDIKKTGNLQVDEIRKLVEGDFLGGEDPNSEGY